MSTLIYEYTQFGRELFVTFVNLPFKNYQMNDLFVFFVF